MREAMVSYFAGEKAQGLFRLSVGPLVLVALVQLGAGIWLLTARAAKLGGSFDADAAAAGAAELRTLFAVACGLIIQKAAMHVLDLVAEQRRARYVSALRTKA